MDLMTTYISVQSISKLNSYCDIHKSETVYDMYVLEHVANVSDTHILKQNNWCKDYQLALLSLKSIIEFKKNSIMIKKD